MIERGAVCILTILCLLAQACAGEITAECNEKEVELGSCLRTMGTTLINKFKMAGLTNFQTPSEEEKKLMEDMATEELCYTDAKQYVDCTIRILSSCSSLIYGDAMKKMHISKDIQMYKWYTYPNADTLCACYKAADCLKKTNEALKPAYVGNSRRGDQQSGVKEEALERILLGQKICRYKDDIRCTLNTMLHSSCKSFLSPDVSRLLQTHGSSNPMSSFIDAQCTGSDSTAGAFDCLFNQTVNTDACFQREGFSTLPETPEPLTCSKIAPIFKCVDDTVGAQCGRKWSKYIQQLINIQVPIESGCWASSAERFTSHASGITALLAVCVNLLIGTVFR